MNCANHPDRERVAFCQNCGKPLCGECSRVVGQAVFCEPCLAARLAGVPGPTAGAGYNGPAGASYGQPGTPVMPRAAAGEPNPGLAALLGFIPGVGAFYNGQYAKGVVHLIVFAVLVSLADEHPIFGLFIAGWLFYQVIEAHHTAKARREGSPLPNPFGLNDLGERLGFGKAWPAAPVGTNDGGYGPAAAQGRQAAPQQGQAGYSAATAGAPQGATEAGWGAPETTYATPGADGYAPVPPDAGTYGQAYDADAASDTPRRLPVGAFVLIGLGSFFLIANTGHFQGVSAQWFLPLALIGIGVWLFVRRMTSAGLSIADDGSPMYRLRLYTALRGALWPILVGVLFFLDFTHILPWGRSWPLFIVLAGVLALLKRTAYADLPMAPPPGATGSTPFAGAPPPPHAPASAAITVLPTGTHDLTDRS